MDVKTGFFYVFAILLLLSAFRVITARNPVHAVLFLVLAFFQASGLWILLKAEFLAISLILVYVGAVMVLFLFVVMMLDINVDSLRRGFWKHFPLAAVIGALIALEEPKAVQAANQAAMNAGIEISNSKELGKLLYTQYLFPLEVTAMILLVAIISAIALTLRERKDSKYQSVDWQVRVKAKDRMEIVKMQATQAPPVSVPMVEAPAEKKA